jgi:hypothetical protein
LKLRISHVLARLDRAGNLHGTETYKNTVVTPQTERFITLVHCKVTLTATISSANKLSI